MPNSNRRDRVILFGAGSACVNYLAAVRKKPDLFPYDHLAIVDSDPRKQDRRIGDLPVIAPDRIAAYSYDKILITSVYLHEIKELLTGSLGVPESKIGMVPKSAMVQTKVYRPFEDPAIHASAENLLKWLIRTFNTHRIEYFVDHGTLLGLFREQRILPWDDDIDLTILESSLEKAHRALESNLDEIGRLAGRAVSVQTVPKGPRTREVTLAVMDSEDDVLFQVCVKTIYFADGWARQNITYAPEKHFLEHDVLSLWGLEIRIPRDSASYLGFHYGNWQTPKTDTSFMDLKNYAGPAS